MKKFLIILFSIIVCILVGLVSSRMQADSLASWYPTLNKSILNPPNWVFPVVWTTLYIFMGISIGLILSKKVVPNKLLLIGLFFVQLVLNMGWSLTFFYFMSPALALINLLLLLVVCVIYYFKASQVSKISSILFIPYILWMCFATYLNAYVALYN